MRRYLDPQGLQRFYDRLGKGLDSQSFYETPAMDLLLQQGDFAKAHNVLDFGCGTGKLARRLLGEALPPDARLAACDLSRQMVGITRERLAAFGSRATVWQAGSVADFAPGRLPFDRICASFVVELLPPETLRGFLSEAHRRLSPGGLLCTTNLTEGARGIPRLVSGLWEKVANLAPGLVGGCHPLDFAPVLNKDRWEILSDTQASSWGVPWEATIARKV